MAGVLMYEPLTIITTDDVIRAGACCEGVMDWHTEFAPDATALPVQDALRLAYDNWIAKAARLDGYGYSYGNRTGSGGNGDGDGYGYGDGGYGDGYGDSGYGDGHGDGYGDGCGCGYD